MTRWRRHARRPRRRMVQRSDVAGTHTRRLRNVTTPGDPNRPVQELRIEHGGVYVLSHLPRHGGATYVGASLRRLQRAAEDIRMLLPDRYRLRVTAALVIPTDPAYTDPLDTAASVQGVLVLDAASLARAVRCATPAFSTSEVSAVERLLRRQLDPVAPPATGRRRRWRHLPRKRSTHIRPFDAARQSSDRETGELAWRFPGMRTATYVTR
jgi:hypothetical protein